MIAWIDSSPAGFFVVTVFVAGGAAFLMGQAMASTWRSPWQVVVYAFLLAAADRFLNFALYEGRLLSPTGYLIDTALLLMVSLLAYRMTLAALMVRQYPWLYARKGLFGWREIGGD